MYLKQLEINGFKSFIGKIELSFTSGINAIVGPNGSGKSNIADAIRWVIGEQSVKTLRGNKMEDVIFSGSEKMKAAGFAEVTLIIDNADKGIDLDYNDISITRRMYRSGESEYYINKTQCRLKDITELFLDTGVGKDGYSIIGQGKIDEILSNKSDDRRAIFEEAAGISKYKYRKLEAEKKMESTQNNIIRIQDILKEIKNQLEPLTEQAEITKKYQKYLHELKMLEVNLIVFNINKSNTKLGNLSDEMDSLDNFIKNKEDLLTGFEKELVNSKIEAKNFEMKCNNLNQKVYELLNLKDKNESEINFCRERGLYINSLLENLLNDNKNAIFEKDKILIEINSYKTDLDLLKNEVSKTGESINSMESEYNEKYSLVNKMENNIEEMKQKHIDFLKKQSDMQNSISVNNEIIKNMNIRLNALINESELFNKQYAEKVNNKIQAENELKEISEKLNINKEEKLLLTHEKEMKDAQINEREKHLTKIGLNKENIISRLKLMEEMSREYEGYNKTIKNILTKQNKIKNLINGYRGVIGELIIVPKDYTVAIEAALGPAVQNIVTDFEDDAKRLIEYLKKNNLGRATFLPINSIKPRQINHRELEKLKISGFVGIATDLIRFDEKYRNIFYYLLGRIVVVEDINTAIQFGRNCNYEIKTVTLDGDIISVGGAITGGSKNNYTGAILSRKTQLSVLKEDYKSVLKEFENCQCILKEEKNEFSILNNRINDLTEVLQKLSIDYSGAKNRLDYIKTDLDLLSSKMEIAKKDIEELKNERNNNKHLVRIKEDEQNAAEEESELILSEMGALEEEIKASKYEKDTFIKNLTELKIKEAELKQQKSSLVKSLSNTVSNENEITEKINNTIISIDKAKNDLKDNQNKESELCANITSLDNNLITLQEELKITEAGKLKQIESQGLLENHIKDCQTEISNLQNNLYKIGLQKNKYEMEVENLEFKLLDTYELSYTKALTYKNEKLVISQSVKRIEELKERIKDLGTVNVNAVIEHERLNNRYNFLKGQLEDLMTAKDSLNTIIEEITNYMESKFLSEFQTINKNFNEVFVKLFGNGSAQVVLTDKDNVLESGIDIVVKPPNKKQQNLMLMSGGERALTAIALLFGILIMKPIPFCVLDEIDSALDDSNVIRYATYLKELSGDLQFIIITHRKGSMEAADCLYGVSMEDTGASVLLSVKLEDKVC